MRQIASGGKPRSMLATYHSQIFSDTNTIKIKIRKSASLQSDISLAADKISSLVGTRNVSSGRTATPRRKRNATPPSCSSSGEEYEPETKHAKAARSHKANKGSKSTPAESALVSSVPAPPPAAAAAPPASSRSRAAVQQTPWGISIPEEVLVQVFMHMESTLPSLVRVGEVCKLWHAASLTPTLWNSVELSQHTKEKWKTDHRLVWILEHRLSMCRHLNLCNWKVSNLPWVVSCIVECCPHLQELNLTGWKRLTPDQLKELVEGLQELQRLDLTRTSETGSSGSCLAVGSLSQVMQTMGARLTHLTLANNKLTGLPSILTSIADNCGNLELLDLSNLCAVSHPALVPLEKLQKGCPRLRVLRITNSQVVLSTASTQEQMESPGFPNLEELSVACPSTDYKLVDDDALGRILKSSTCLRLLDVRGCIRISDSGLIKVPAWDLQHLFLSGCCVTRQSSSCLELICEKWSHSLLEVDMAWATATQPLDAAVEALAEKGDNSNLRILNLCGSSVSYNPVKKILLACPALESVNLSSCRALPRGMKRLYSGRELEQLRESLDPSHNKVNDNEVTASADADSESSVRAPSASPSCAAPSPSTSTNLSPKVTSASPSTSTNQSPKVAAASPSGNVWPMSTSSPLPVASPSPSPSTNVWSPSVAPVASNSASPSSPCGVPTASPSPSNNVWPMSSSSPSGVHVASPSPSNNAWPRSSSSPSGAPAASPSASNNVWPMSTTSPSSALPVPSPSNVWQMSSSPSAPAASPSTSNNVWPMSSSSPKVASPNNVWPSPSAMPAASPSTSNNVWPSPSVTPVLSHSASASPSGAVSSGVWPSASPLPSPSSPYSSQPSPQDNKHGWNLKQFQESANSNQASPEAVSSSGKPGQWNLDRWSQRGNMRGAQEQPWGSPANMWNNQVTTSCPTPPNAQPHTPQQHDLNAQ